LRIGQCHRGTIDQTHAAAAPVPPARN
jgi:hypothetical protein